MINLSEEKERQGTPECYPKEFLERIHFWSPPIALIHPQKEKLNSSLRIAGIVSPRLFQGLKYEGELFLLTPDNWLESLENERIDLLIIESCWETATGHWYLSQITQNEQYESLLKIIQLARKLSIPSVFWNTRDHLYHNHYKDFSRLFDYIFCADNQEVEMLQKQHVNAEILLPAIQPATHNPFKAYEHVNEFEIGVLFDGWIDLIRLTDKLKVLKTVQRYGLSIIESRGRLLHNKLKGLPDYQQSILGCVTEEARQTALKYAKTALTFDASFISTTEQQWRTLEMAGFRLPVLYRGILPEDDIRKNIVDERATDKALLKRLNHYQEDELDREKNAHLTWREVHNKHTFSHRIQTICQKVGLTHDWVEYPAISMITPTFREGLLPRCVDTFGKQKYPNKELIIIFNSNTETMPKIEGVDSYKKDIQVIQVPQERFVGNCLNLGSMIARGEYCIRVDDDDYYGEYCILDIALHLRAADLDVFGKPTYYFYFEGEKSTYQRPFRTPALSIIPTDKLSQWNTHVAGNLLGGRRNFLISKGYPQQAFAAADSSFFYDLSDKKFNYASLDGTNVVIHRSQNLKIHTWRHPKENIIKNAITLKGKLPHNIMY